jgi:hypothetical protein
MVGVSDHKVKIAISVKLANYSSRVVLGETSDVSGVDGISPLWLSL